jgi:hypothetical protein
LRVIHNKFKDAAGVEKRKRLVYLLQHWIEVSFRVHCVCFLLVFIVNHVCASCVVCVVVVSFYLSLVLPWELGTRSLLSCAIAVGSPLFLTFPYCTPDADAVMLVCEIEHLRSRLSPQSRRQNLSLGGVVGFFGVHPWTAASCLQSHQAADVAGAASATRSYEARTHGKTRVRAGDVVSEPGCTSAH